MVPHENVESLMHSDGTNASLPILPKIFESKNEIIVLDTNAKAAPEPGEGLVETRIKRVTAILGEGSELVSVAVQAYNRLEKTKICVECILKYTTEFEYELILFDNGSNDGTFDYFQSIEHPRKKIIRVTKNVGSTVNILFNHFSGRYLAYVFGDVYVTKNWLKNLLTCIKSEATIGMVVPVSSNMSWQGIDMSFNTLGEMHKKAAQHNVTDPRLWHERLTVFPPVALYKRETVELAGGWDSGIYHYLGDNDLSFRIRRAGYKTMICKDTFVHHDHNRANPSEKDPEESKRSHEAGRKDFRTKYFGIDAWEDINNFESTMMSLVNPQKQLDSDALEILGVDVLCGTPILELKNKLREANIYNIRLSAFSIDPKYWYDLKTICAGEVVVDRIEFINEYFSDTRFDLGAFHLS